MFPLDGLRSRLLQEDNRSHYSIYPDSTKIYHDLREVFWWEHFKKDITEFVAKCPNCKEVKVEHEK